MSQDVKHFSWLAEAAAPVAVVREAIQCIETPDNDNSIYTSCVQEKSFDEEKSELVGAKRWLVTLWTTNNWSWDHPILISCSWTIICMYCISCLWNVAQCNVNKRYVYVQQWLCIHLIVVTVVYTYRHAIHLLLLIVPGAHNTKERRTSITVPEPNQIWKVPAAHSFVVFRHAYCTFCRRICKQSFICGRVLHSFVLWAPDCTYEQSTVVGYTCSPNIALQYLVPCEQVLPTL